jgi:hypothetical protein
MPDNFSAHQPGLSSPARGGFAITPDDDNDLTRTTRGLHCAGDAGDVAVVWLSGEETTIYIPQGGVFPGQFTRVKATGTTATELVGLD